VPSLLRSSLLRPGRLARLACAVLVCAVAGTASAQNRPSGNKQGEEKRPPSFSEKTAEAFQKLKPLQDAQDWNGMLRLLDAIPTTPGSYDEAYILNMKAKIYGQLGQYGKALGPWERAVELSDQHGYFNDKEVTEIVYYLGQLYAQEATTSKDPKVQQPLFTKAVNYFQRYLDKTPKPSAEAITTFATILYYKASADPANVDAAALKQAQAMVERAMTMSIKPKENLYQLRMVMQQQQEDYTGVAESLELLLKQNPQKKDSWTTLMGIYHHLAEKATDPDVAREYRIRAIVTLERAQALGFANTPRDNMNLVSMYLQSNQHTKGTELLYNGMKKGTIESEPHNWRLLGRFYQEANFNDRAIEVLKEAAKLFPKNGEIEWHIAQIYVQLEKMTEASEHAKAALAKGNFETSKPYNIYYLLAYAAFEDGKMEEAGKWLDEAGKFEEAQKDSQFVRLKEVVTQELAEREAKTEKDKSKESPAQRKTAGR
jgi:tetratricopeptide (TPR) repeat protein